MELWTQLYDDNCANGFDNVAPFMNPNSISQENVNVNLEEEEDKNINEEVTRNLESIGDQVYSQYSRYAFRVDNLLREENYFFGNFMNEVNGTQVPSQGTIFSQVPKYLAKVIMIPKYLAKIIVTIRDLQKPCLPNPFK